jgi:hypothetical protein
MPNESKYGNIDALVHLKYSYLESTFRGVAVNLFSLLKK